MLRLLLLLMVLCNATYADLITSGRNNNPKESLQTDVSEMCVYQETSHVVLGSETCDANYFLSVQGTSATKGLISLTRIADTEGEVANAALYIANGNGSLVGNRTVYVTDGVVGTDSPIIQDYIVDTANATGGAQMPVIRVIKAGGGDIEVAALAAAPGVIPIAQAYGAGFISANPVFKYGAISTTFTTITTEAGDSGSNVSMFNLDNDIVYVGAATPFDIVEFNLSTPASANIVPVFEYWNGSTWTSFSPGDGTSGMTTSGQIGWTIANLTGWTTTTVNSQSKYYIRITRTVNALTTVPIESTIRTIGFVVYRWGSDGVINIKTVDMENGSVTRIADGDGQTGLRIQMNANGYGFSTATSTTFTATDVVAGEFPAVHDVSVDTANSQAFSGIAGMRVFQTGTGSIDVRGQLIGPGVGPILQGSSTTGLIFVNKAFKQAFIGGAFTDITAAAADVGTNVNMFNADNDRVYIGADATFAAVEFNLQLNASGTGITPTFEYWNGSAWTVFVAVDGTNGMRASGQISFDPTNLTGWATTTVNSSLKYWIRINRTADVLGVLPIENTIRYTSLVLYSWDENADLAVRDVVTRRASADTMKLTTPASSIGTCDSSTLGTVRMYILANNTSPCVCFKTGASTYAWGPLVVGTTCP